MKSVAIETFGSMNRVATSMPFGIGEALSFLSILSLVTFWSRILISEVVQGEIRSSCQLRFGSCELRENCHTAAHIPLIIRMDVQYSKLRMSQKSLHFKVLIPVPTPRDPVGPAEHPLCGMLLFAPSIHPIFGA
jgi:hypothetical protein